MKKSRIYTKTGDMGETGLVSGNRALKSDPRIDLYGELDELNSRLGLSCSQLFEKKGFEKTCEFIHVIQSAIFDLGSNLACEPENRISYQLPQINGQLILDLEASIDLMDSALPDLKNFILPGGCTISSTIHLCRTNARSVERKIVHFHHVTQEELPENSLVFLNRLSDYLFVLARFVNFQLGIEEINWKPPKKNH
jgi:cob(I)alamin adenosyltransferase